MTNDEIISWLYQNKKLRNYCKKICIANSVLSDDMYSEAITTLIEKRYNLMEVCDNDLKKVEYFFCAFLFRTYRSNSTAIKYRHEFTSTTLPRNIYVTDSTESELRERKAKEDMNEMKVAYIYRELQPSKRDTEMDYLRKNLYKLYVENGSYRKVAKLTRIPYPSICNYLKKYRKEIAERANKYAMRYE